jgi:hypothetical protein
MYHLKRSQDVQFKHIAYSQYAVIHFVFVKKGYVQSLRSVIYITNSGVLVSATNFSLLVCMLLVKYKEMFENNSCPLMAR